MTVSEQRLVAPDAPGELILPSYAKPQPGNHPPLDFPPYKSTGLRHPTRPLVLLPHRLTEVTGWFEVLGEKIRSISDDQRIQAILIAFCFGALLESLAGFGAPVAISAAMCLWELPTTQATPGKSANSSGARCA